MSVGPTQISKRGEAHWKHIGTYSTRTNEDDNCFKQPNGETTYNMFWDAKSMLSFNKRCQTYLTFFEKYFTNSFSFLDKLLKWLIEMKYNRMHLCLKLILLPSGFFNDRARHFDLAGDKGYL